MSCISSLSSLLIVYITFAQFGSEAAHAQAKAQSAKSSLVLWNRPKLVLQTLGKPANRLQALDRKLNVPRTFAHLKSEAAHAQAKAQSAKSFLALWNRPKLVLQTLGKFVIRLQALDRKLNVPRTIAHFRSEAAHAQAQAQTLWNRPKIVLQTLGKFVIRLQALDRKLNVPRTIAHFRSEAAHAQAQAQALWNRPKIVLQTLGKLAIRLQALDRKLNVPRTFAHFKSEAAHAQAKAQSAKSFLALWNPPKLVLQHT